MSKVYEEIKVAYADCQRIPPTEEDYARRNLDYRAGEWICLEGLKPCLLAIGRYNEFVPEDVIAVLEKVAAEAEVLFQPAREGSVALYILCDADTAYYIQENFEALQYDECDYHNGIIRLWWD